MNYVVWIVLFELYNIYFLKNEESNRKNIIVNKKDTRLFEIFRYFERHFLDFISKHTESRAFVHLRNLNIFFRFPILGLQLVYKNCDLFLFSF